MTLHWWMHWFWVTAQIVVTLTGPTTSDQRTTESVAVTETSTTTTTTATTTTTSLSDKADSLAKLQQSYRIAKAIGIQPPMNVATVSQNFDQPSVTTDSSRSFQFSRYGSTVSSGFDRLRSSPSPPVNRTAFEVFENKTSQPGRIPGKKEAKITWVQAFSKPQKAKYEEKSSTPSSLSLLTSSTPSANDSGNEPTSEETLTVMPLQRQDDKSIDPNSISRSKPLLVATNRSITEELLLGRETVEPHAIATAASILDAAVGLGDSTRLGRARGTFTSEFHLDQLSREERPRSAVGKGKEEAPINETAPETSSANVTEIATITGSCLAIIILLSTVGSLGFIMYRRRYLNPPQTLNSDKCSNPDSSGYIDDSTIRDNSEEMYSLDNDSFLNSLEAMTIQNYWTDSVKHTKL